MRLSTKHENQTQIIRADFSGGLNTSISADNIADNQLSLAVNVEIDHSTGRLKTVAGTTDILKLNSDSANIVAAMYDEINYKLLLVREVEFSEKTFRAVSSFDLETYEISSALGLLSGSLYPIYANWESGILIATGGKLQYFNGQTLITIADSPNATSVWTKAGRVFVTDENNVICSGVGDEEHWTEDTGVDSSAKFIEVGYKDGGKLIGMVNLASNVLLVKDNRRVYSLNGEFPDWSISEVSRNVDVRGRMSTCAAADSVFILGREEVQAIQGTSAYGNMKPQDIAMLITSKIRELEEDSFLRYVPKLNQIWALSGEVVLIYDLVTQSWFKRQFNSPVVDVISAGDEVFVIKADRVSKLDETTFSDSGETLSWEFKCKSHVSQHDYLLKRTQVSYIPLDAERIKGEIFAGKVVVSLSLTERGRGTRRPLLNGEILAQSFNVYRNKVLEIGGSGSTGGIIFNSIILDVVDV